MWPIIIQTLINLTLVAVLAIINSRKKRIFLRKVGVTQSQLYAMARSILPSNKSIMKARPTQSKNFVEKGITRFVATPDKAYWVKDNIFYQAEVIDGEVSPTNAVPINTDGLSKIELEELLFILDSLKKGPE